MPPIRRPRATLLLLALLASVAPRTAKAQWRVGADSADRWTRFGRDVAYGSVEGLGFAAYDQWRKDPPEWGTDGSGFGKRVASNIGEFVIQESVTEGLAAAMRRPLGYKHCGCRDAGTRFWWAVRGAVTDAMPDGSHPVAIPRIAGAYAGSFAQASWRPSHGNSRARVALANGTVSLGIGALINLFYEFR